MPATVRCNRGLGWTFWMVIAIIVVITALTAVGASRTEPDEVLPRLAVGVITIGIFVVLRVILLPAFAVDVAGGFIRTRFRRIPLSEISLVDFIPERRAGYWVRFHDDTGRRVAQLSLWGSLYSPADSEQWAALRYVIATAAAARGTAIDHVHAVQSRRDPICVADALQRIDAHLVWLAEGGRAEGRRSPGASLMASVIALPRFGGQPASPNSPTR